MANANSTVLEIAVVEAETGIEEDFFDTNANSDFDLAGKVIAHLADWVGFEIKVTNFADVFSLDVAKDYSRIVGGGQAEEFVVIFGGSEIKNLCAGFEAGASDSRLIGLDGNEDAR